MQPRLRGLLALLALLMLAACATEPAPSPIRLPVSASKPPMRRFRRRRNYNRRLNSGARSMGLGRGQIALHDDRYMDVIYGVITLPGPVDEGQTAEQRTLPKGHYETLKELLRQVEFKSAANIPLTPAEQSLANYIRKSSGGPGAIAGASERLRSQRGLRERFKRGLEISGRYDAAFRGVFREAGLPRIWPICRMWSRLFRTMPLLRSARWACGSSCRTPRGNS